MHLEASDLFEPDITFGLALSHELHAAQFSIGRVGTVPHSVVLNDVMLRELNELIVTFLNTIDGVD